MRTVKKLTGALVMAGMVAGALVVSVVPAAAEPSGLHGGQWKACSYIKTAADNAPNEDVKAVLYSIFNAFCG